MKIYQALILLTAVLLMIGCKSTQPSAANTPGDVLKQYVAASQKNDIETMKRLLSKGSLALIEKSAKAQGTTTDDLLRKEAAVKIQNAPEIRNEKIEGDAATVEVKNETNGEFDMKMPLVREDGAWKLARDKYIEEVMKKATDDVNKKLADSSLSNGGSNSNSSAPNTNAGNSAANK